MLTLICYKSRHLAFLSLFVDFAVVVVVFCFFCRGEKVTNQLGRVSVSDVLQHILYDRIVLPPEGYQVLWGSMAQHGHLTRDDLQNSPVPYEEARDMVVSLLKVKLMVGHDVGHDHRALHYQHPPADVRDTAEHYSVEQCRQLGLIGPEGLLEHRQGLQYSLKDLVRVVHQGNIQQARHDSVKDA